MLYGDNFLDELTGYRNWIDMDSWVDYFILNEFAMIRDAGNLSTYAYKKLDGKIQLAVWDFNNMPQLIYGKWMQRIGTFLLPVFVITNFPGLFLMGELSVPMAVWGVAAPVVFFLIARAVWNRAVKNYTSAST